MSQWMLITNMYASVDLGLRLVTFSSDGPECPICGRPFEWCEFIESQDIQGNDIMGGQYECRDCGISAEYPGGPDLNFLIPRTENTDLR